MVALARVALLRRRSILVDVRRRMIGGLWLVRLLAVAGGGRRTVVGMRLLRSAARLIIPYK